MPPTVYSFMSCCARISMSYINQLALVGVTVKGDCSPYDHAASGYVELKAPNVINVCLEPDRIGYERVLRHEAIHVAQLRLGVGKVNQLLEKCSHEYEPESWVEGDSYEAPAHGYENSECAKQIILQALSEPPPSPKPQADPLNHLLGGMVFLLIVVVGASWWPTK